MFILNMLKKIVEGMKSSVLFKETSVMVWGLVYEIIYKQRHLNYAYFSFRYTQPQLK